MQVIVISKKLRYLFVDNNVYSRVLPLVEIVFYFFPYKMGPNFFLDMMKGKKIIMLTIMNINSTILSNLLLLSLSLLRQVYMKRCV